MFLIIGASGFIGNKLYNYFKSKGLDVKGTYYSKVFEGPEEDKIYLDLSNPDFSEILNLKNITHIFFCNGITSIDKCKSNYEISYEINVTNTINLLDNFIQTDTIPIFLSTDMVYSGTKRFYKEEDEVCPITEYGKQKADVEKYITKHFRKYIILRLTKVYGIEKSDKTLFTSWLDSLIEYKSINSAVDDFISPVFIMDVVEALEGLVSGNHYGIFNLGGHEILSRYELSLKFAEFFEFNNSLVQKKFIKDFRFIDLRPLYSSLNSSKIIEVTGIKLTSLEDCFRLIKKNYKMKSEKHNMHPISVSDKKTIFKNRFIDLYSVKADFEGFTKNYFVADWGHRVGILLLKKGSVLLIKQYRFLIDDYSWEIPGGAVNKDENLEKAAIRECEEESGIRCNSLTPFFDYMMGIEVTRCPTHLFYTSDFQETGVFDKREINAVKWVPFPKCIEMIFTGKIKDMMTIVALLTFSGQKLG